MAEDDGQEKTEDATPKRISDAREKGNVPKSADLAGAVVLLIGILSLMVLGPMIFDHLAAFMIRSIESIEDIGNATMTIDDFKAITASTMVYMAYMGMPILMLIAVGAVLIHLMEFGFIFSTEPIRPKLEKVQMNPFKWTIDQFKLKAIMRMVMGVLKICVVAGVSYFAIKDDMGYLITSIHFGVGQTFGLLCEMFLDVALMVTIVLLILGIIDFSYQKYQYKEEMKMSKQDVKDEMKQMEGDQKIKGRRLQMARQQAMSRMMNDTGQADVVVTNPTEYAVALRYDQDQEAAPIVVAKGRNLIAQKIRAVALENDVMIVSNPPLARELFRSVEVGHMIPEKLYIAVSEIFAMVFSQNKNQSTPAPDEARMAS